MRCVRTSCDFVDNVTEDTSSHSSICACNFIAMTGFSYLFFVYIFLYEVFLFFYLLLYPVSFWNLPVHLQPTLIGMNWYNTQI